MTSPCRASEIRFGTYIALHWNVAMGVPPMLMRTRLFITALFLSMITATAALAAPVFTTGSFGYGLPNSTTSDVTTVTVIQNYGEVVLQSVTGDFTGFLAPLDMFAVPSPTDFNSLASFSWPMGGIGSFAATSIVKGDITMTGPQATAIWYIYGTFTVGSDYANAGTELEAIKTISLTQTGGPGRAISYSGTVYVSGGNSNIPEPATLLLIGSGALLLGFRRRRKRNA
jgi:hypothetical protein